MEIGPLLPGRMPALLGTARLQAELNEGHRALALLQDQISTGHRFQLPSDDPAEAQQAISLQSLLERKTQSQTNVETGQSLLSATETYLAAVADVMNKAKQLASAGVGDGSTQAEKAAMAQEVQSLIQETLNAANATFRGRYLFGGSDATTPPFSQTADGFIRYSGDQQSLEAYVDLALRLPTNVDGNSAFGALTAPVGGDVNPALTLSTKLSDLFGGRGVVPGQISVSLSSPASTQVVDLSQAKTVGDLKTILENAFGAANLTVSINAGQNGISIAPTAGTITIANVAGDETATNLNLVATAAVSVDSGDLDPRLTMSTKLADLNGGTGIGPTAGTGLLIKNGPTTQAIDISSAVTVEDLLNLLRAPDLNLAVGINEDGNGLAISSRLSGAGFSIGENGGQNATLLGLRTFTANTRLADLNYGQGVPASANAPLKITRRDGTTVNVDLTSAATVQDVLNAINAVDPGNLVAALNTVGNGISILDNSGTGPLSIDANETATALGLAGTESGSNPAVPLVGTDVNLREAAGTFNVLLRLQKALESNNNIELTRINTLADAEQTRLTSVRGDLGQRMQTLDQIGNRLKDQDIQTRDALSKAYDSDIAQVLSELVARQTAFEALLKMAAQTLQITLANYI